MENKITVNFKPIYATTQTIMQHLNDLGIPANLHGYVYLKHGIYEVLNDESLIHATTKCLYPLIASECNTTASRVERAIRFAIESSFNNACMDADRCELVRKYFGNTLSAESGKPTNTQFIAAVAERIRIDALVAAEASRAKIGEMMHGQM